MKRILSINACAAILFCACVRTNAALIPGPLDDGAIDRLKAHVSAAPQSLVLVQLRGQSAAEPWQAAAGFRVVQRYALPHGRRYSLLQPDRGP